MRDGKPVPLTPKAALILCVLVENRGKLVERAEIMRRVWPDVVVEEGNLTVTIFALRKALAEGFGDVPVIETIPRRGYRLVAAVTQLAGARPRLRFQAIAVAGLLLALAAWLLLPPRTPRVVQVTQLTHFGLAEALGADGARLFAGQKRGGRFSVVQVAAGTGEPLPLSLPFPNVRLLDVSPVREEMLVSCGDGASPVWIVPSGSGLPRRLGDIKSISARWSPDGSRIAYDSEGALYIAARDGSGARKVAEPGGQVDAWSPDGARLRFTRTNQATGGESLWEVRADGSGLRPVLPERQLIKARWGEGQCCGRWTPDGRYFLFRESFGSDSSLWVMREGHALATPARLYAAAFEIGDFMVSPDGKRLLLVGINQSRELVRFDRKLRQWAPIALDPAASSARWSPDGEWVAYNTFPGHTLWRSRADGSERLQLTFSPMQVFGGVWSPDGRRIAFHLLAPGKPGKIGVVPAGGGETQVLLAEEKTGEDSPNWSADGNSLLFIRNTLDRDGNTTASVMASFDFRTGRVSELPGTAGLGPPAWSPDGRYIAAQSADFHQLMLLDSRAGQWAEVAHGGFIHNPLWSRDGASILYQDRAAGEEQTIYRVAIPSLSVEAVAGRSEFLRADFGTFSLAGVTPANEPLASVIHRNADIYALTLDWP